jgi:hypothetical protein
MLNPIVGIILIISMSEIFATYITHESTMCCLQVELLDVNKMVVAQGLVQPKTTEQKIYCVHLPTGMVRAVVTEVPQGPALMLPEDNSRSQPIMCHTWSVQGLSHQVAEVKH